MRLIDADILLKESRISKYYHLPNGDIAIPIIDIKHAKTIDAVEVVRCEYCKYYVGEMFFGREVFFCNRKYKQGSGMMELTDADDFCSYGKRKTDG